MLNKSEQPRELKDVMSISPEEFRREIELILAKATTREEAEGLVKTSFAQIVYCWIEVHDGKWQVDVEQPGKEPQRFIYEKQ